MVNQPSSINLKDILVSKNERAILSIKQAEISTTGITALVGPNGSGKTTLLKLLHGLITPNKGNISSPSLESALVLHHTPLIKGSTRLNLRLLKDLIPNLSNEDIDQALHEYGLSHLADQVATKLSAGERQRLGLARARLQKPKMIFLDEPTANLDPKATDQIESLIKNMAKSGIGFVIATHDLMQAKRLSEKVLLLANGAMAEHSDTGLFFEQPKTDIAKSFIARQLGWE
jgi:tungstate transport system ATP-binding protein